MLDSTMIARLQSIHPLMVAVPVFALLATAEAWACPGCKQAAAESGADVAAGFSYTIYAMISAPLILVATVLTVVVRSARSAGTSTTCSHND